MIGSLGKSQWLPPIRFDFGFSSESRRRRLPLNYYGRSEGHRETHLHSFFTAVHHHHFSSCVGCVLSSLVILGLFLVAAHHELVRLAEHCSNVPGESAHDNIPRHANAAILGFNALFKPQSTNISLYPQVSRTLRTQRRMFSSSRPAGKQCGTLSEGFEIAELTGSDHSQNHHESTASRQRSLAVPVVQVPRHCTKDLQPLRRPGVQLLSVVRITNTMRSSSVLVVPVCVRRSVSRKLASTLLAFPSSFRLDLTPSPLREVSMRLSESTFTSHDASASKFFMVCWSRLNVYQHARRRLEMAHVRHREGFRLAW